MSWGPEAKRSGTIIGSSRTLLEALEVVDRVARSSSPVLLVGETGTGKDLIAARIHARGPRRNRPYVVAHAGATPAARLDSELFGHVTGAFTGAAKARRGLLVEADGGTLFLDEIADLPLELQGRLLRVLEAKTLRPVGADLERPIDVRIIASTHRDLSHAVRAGTFREDLFFRLDVLSVHIPPLRERREDLQALISFFFDAARARNPHSPVLAIAPEASEELLRNPWRGNARELQACIERLVVQGATERVEKSDVTRILSARAQSPAPEGRPADVDRREVDHKEVGWTEASPDFVSLREMTMKYLEAVLHHTGGDKARAAAILEVDLSTLYRWQRRRRMGT